MKKIFIPFSRYNSVGGPSTFINNFCRFLDDVDEIVYTDDYLEAVSMFFPISYNSRVLRYFADNGYPIIQRLDGVYYKERHGLERVIKNYKIKKAYRLSTYKIFQSNFSRDCCFREFGEIPEDHYSIIYNGADQRIFYAISPDKRPAGRSEWKFLSFGNFRNIDMLRPIIKSLDMLKGVIRFSFTVIGPLGNKKILNLLSQTPYVHYVKKMPPSQLAERLRCSDLFLFCSLNSSCPNAAIEAISTGTPVIAFGDGAMPELMAFAEDLLVPCRNSGQQYVRESDLPLELYAEKIIKCIDNMVYYRDLFFHHSNEYSFSKCGYQYLEILKKFSF